MEVSLCCEQVWFCNQWKIVLYPFGVGRLITRCSEIYFGFKWDDEHADTTLGLSLVRKCNEPSSLYFGDVLFSLQESNSLSLDAQQALILALPINKDLTAFAQTNVNKERALQGKKQYTEAALEMQKIIDDARARGIKIPAKALAMMKEVRNAGN